MEEFINYFDYVYLLLERGNVFVVEIELGGCFWQEGYQLLYIGIKGFEVSLVDVFFVNLVFLIDVFGFMGSINKFLFVKQALGLFIEEFRVQDWVFIVIYVGGFQVVLLFIFGD